MTVSLKPDSQAQAVADRHPVERVARFTIFIGHQCLSVHHFERHFMDMHRMGICGEVIELPYLGVAHVRVLGDWIRPHVMQLACHPHPRLPNMASAGPS